MTASGETQNAYTAQQTLSQDYEQSRVETLHSLNILDTAFEDRFDRYTTLLASIFQFPICLISLVDTNRQWFKSCHGLNFRETAREHSFCAHALTHKGLFIVPDATKDPRFAENPLVSGPPCVRFYAGAVLYGPEGMPLGTLCLLDRKPRTFSDRDSTHLRQFADLVERELLLDHRIQKIRLAERYSAVTDALTDLPNQRLFEDRLNQFVQIANTQKNVSFIVLHIDIVDFLHVNRTLGREAGDTVLKDLAARLRRLCPVEGSVARLHADRFAMVTPQSRSDDEQEPGALVNRLARELSRPFFIGAREQFLRLRIGASIYRDASDTADVLLERAAAAARSGNGQLRTGVSAHFHDYRLEASFERQFELENRLRAGLENNQFQLVFQPVFDIASGRPVSLEALIRWHEPALGDVSPDEFVPLAEATGLILPIGHWVLRDALRQYREWEDQDICPLPIHVNVSARELEHPDFVDRVLDLLAKAEVPGEALCLEITETVLIEDMAANAEKMQALFAHGVRFYIDDFGKGYSSLQYVRQLPFSALKIDQSFISKITEEPDDAAIARAVIAMGHSLGMTVIAEGVETEAQLELLRAARCDQAQGFLLARPLTAAQIGTLEQY